MTPFEIMVFFEANKWVENTYVRLEYNSKTNNYILYRRTYQDKWIIWSKSYNKEIQLSTMFQYIDGPKCDKFYGTVELDLPNVKCELIEEQKIAIKIIQGDSMAIDLVRDICTQN